MYKVERCFRAISAVVLLGLAPFAAASGADPKVANALENRLSSLVASQDYLAASVTAVRLASARSQRGETAAACAALSQSTEYYREGLIQEIGYSETVASSIDEHSEGIAVLRARFGCEASPPRAQMAKPF